MTKISDDVWSRNVVTSPGKTNLWVTSGVWVENKWLNMLESTSGRWRHGVTLYFQSHAFQINIILAPEDLKQEVDHVWLARWACYRSTFCQVIVESLIPRPALLVLNFRHQSLLVTEFWHHSLLVIEFCFRQNSLHIRTLVWFSLVYVHRQILCSYAGSTQLNDRYQVKIFQIKIISHKKIIR